MRLSHQAMGLPVSESWEEDWTNPQPWTDPVSYSSMDCSSWEGRWNFQLWCKWLPYLHISSLNRSKYHRNSGLDEVLMSRDEAVFSQALMYIIGAPKAKHGLSEQLKNEDCPHWNPTLQPEEASSSQVCTGSAFFYIRLTNCVQPKEKVDVNTC